MNNQFLSILADKRKNNGGKRQGAGRKSKAEEQKLVERLTPLAPAAHRKLKEAIGSGEQWAVKLFFEYMYGRPVTRTAVTDSSGNDVKGFQGFAFLGNIDDDD